MCVIAIKPSGIKVPDKELIADMWDTNPDGAGFMLRRKGTTQIILRKGFMSLKKFRRALNSMSVHPDDDLIMHFRITTSGGTNQRNTHPFIIENLDKGTERLEAVTDKICVAHNGVIYDLNDAKAYYSDTARFVMEYLSDPAVYGAIYTSKAVQQMIGKFIGASRLSFLCPENGILMIGEWKDKDGLYFSNLNFLPKPTIQYYPQTTHLTRSEWEENYYGRTKKEKEDESQIPLNYKPQPPIGFDYNGAKFKTETILLVQADKEEFSSFVRRCMRVSCMTEYLVRQIIFGTITSKEEIDNEMDLTEEDETKEIGFKRPKEKDYEQCIGCYDWFEKGTLEVSRVFAGHRICLTCINTLGEIE